MKKSILMIDKQIEALRIRRNKIQDKCKHVNLEKEYKSSTDSFDPSYNSFWTAFHCLDCDKNWSEKGSK